MRYPVKAGDTLSKIAKAYGMTFEQLLNANPKYRAHPDGIRVGAQVNIPLSAGQAQEAANWLGTLSAKYERGGRGPGTVSSGVGEAGGISYGSYQMSSKGGGTVGRFISQPDFPWRDEFQNLIPGSKDFTAKWKEIAKLHPAEFQEAQHAYIKRTHFDLLVVKFKQGDKMKIKQGDKIDITSRSHALQNVVWSTAVQHGPNTPVVHRALETLRSGGTLNLADPEFDKKLIKAIYAERGRKDAQGKLVYFSRNSPEVQKGVAKRFVNEQKDALKMLESEK